ncbi:MAG: di-heme oxidoredictase family protein, partial [Pseudomonadota bacterium]
MAAASVGLAVASVAAPLDDLHLNVVPRTDEERARIAAVTAPPTQFETPEAFENRPGGAATVRAMRTRDAFSQPSANIGFEQELDFKVGNGLFKKLWVSSPSSTLASDGLGPLYNARSCQRCHVKDGRGHPPDGPMDNAVSMFLRISIPGGAADAPAGIEGWIPTRPDPVYGEQMQDFAVAGHPAEYRFSVAYEEVEVVLADGETVVLRRPTYEAADLGYGPLHPEAMLSPRVAPQMIGLGLLEAIPTEDILALADPDDADGDGVSGRPSIVPSKEFGRPMLGRFGLKAGAPTVKAQSAGAFAGDIGISNPLAPAGWGECTEAQVDCRSARHGGDPGQDGFEVDAAALDLVTFYSRNLAVPARRDVDHPEVLRGKAVFHASGCAACHQPKFVTARLVDQPEQSFQLIWPYTDMLLHDMGEDLADGRPEGRANGREWRTAPL